MTVNNRPLANREARIFVVVIAAFALLQVVTTINVLEYFPKGFETENFYHPLAVNLVNHGTYGFGETPSIERTTFRPPGYSATLAALYAIFGQEEIVGLVLNNILLLGTFLTVFLVGRRWYPYTGLAAVIILALDPIYLAQSNRNQSDLLFMFLIAQSLMWGLRAIERPLHYGPVLLLALALGAATFTRAAAVYMWVPTALVLVIAHLRVTPARTITALCLLTVIQAAFVVPWMVRNEGVSGNRDYAGMKGTHIAAFFAPLVIANRDGRNAQEVKNEFVSEITNSTEYKSLSLGDQEKYLADIGWGVIKSNWVHVLTLLPANIPKMFLGYASEPFAVFLDANEFQAWDAFRASRHDASFGSDPWSISDRLEQVRYYISTGLFPILAYGVFLKFLNLTVLVFAAIWIARAVFFHSREDRNRALFILLTIGLLSGISLLTTQARFRVPVMFALALPAGIVLLSLLDRVRHRIHGHTTTPASN